MAYVNPVVLPTPAEQSPMGTLSSEDTQCRSRSGSVLWSSWSSVASSADSSFPQLFYRRTFIDAVDERPNMEMSPRAASDPGSEEPNLANGEISFERQYVEGLGNQMRDYWEHGWQGRAAQTSPPAVVRFARMPKSNLLGNGPGASDSANAEAPRQRQSQQQSEHDWQGRAAQTSPPAVVRFARMPKSNLLENGQDASDSASAEAPRQRQSQQQADENAVVGDTLLWQKTEDVRGLVFSRISDTVGVNDTVDPAPKMRRWASFDSLSHATEDEDETHEPTVMNFGSAGHPELCPRPCIYISTSRGCLNGSSCDFCHLPHTTRPAHLDKTQREFVRGMTSAERQALIIPLLRQKLNDLNLEEESVEEIVALVSDSGSSKHFGIRPTTTDASGLIRGLSGSKSRKLVAALKAMSVRGIFMLIPKNTEADALCLKRALDTVVRRLQYKPS